MNALNLRQNTIVNTHLFDGNFCYRKFQIMVEATFECDFRQFSNLSQYLPFFSFQYTDTLLRISQYGVKLAYTTLCVEESMCNIDVCKHMQTRRD